MFDMEVRAMYWAVEIPGAKLLTHGVDPAGGPAVALRGGRVVDANMAARRQGFRPGATAAVPFLADLGVAMVAARPWYDPEPELLRLWQAGWAVEAQELGDYLFRVDDGREPAGAFAGPVIAAAGPSPFWARLRLAADGTPDGSIPIRRLSAVGFRPALVRRLEQLGVATIGELAALLRQGGGALPPAEAERLRRALDGEPVVPFRPWAPPPAAKRRRRLPGGVVDWAPLLAALKELVASAAAELRRAGAAARLAELAVEGEGFRREARRPLSPPTGRVERLLALLSADLRRLAPPGPVEAIALTLVGAPPVSTEQGLFGLSRPAPGLAFAAVVPEARELRLACYDPLRWEVGTCPV
jgi:hypothetical protein